MKREIIISILKLEEELMENGIDDETTRRHIQGLKKHIKKEYNKNISF